MWYLANTLGVAEVLQDEEKDQKKRLLKLGIGTSLVVPWLRFPLPI